MCNFLSRSDLWFYLKNSLLAITKYPFDRIQWTVFDELKLMSAILGCTCKPGAK